MEEWIGGGGDRFGKAKPLRALCLLLSGSYESPWAVKDLVVAAILDEFTRECLRLLAYAQQAVRAV